MKAHQCEQDGCHRVIPFEERYCQIHAKLHQDYRGRNQYQINQSYNRARSKDDRIKFYHTRTWSHLRQLAIQRDHSLCRYCLIDGIVTPFEYVDHIVPVEFDVGKQKDITNLVCACKSCHEKKTAWEQRYYGTGENNQLRHRVIELMNVRAVANAMNG
ncbi:HNH endonuclease [Oenococcus sp.]|uniref:HNH endonuclease n=1 Tax=Oenococcus sp. TaxID=1979414 RepID=UPI0039EA5475